MSDYSKSALEILRNPQVTLKWYVVPLLLLVMYIYYKELSEKHYSVVMGAAALWGMDLFNEIWNSIVFHAGGLAPVWGTPWPAGDTALLLLIGYNIEISFMFAVMGIVVCLALPKDTKKKFFGVNNRVFYVVVFTSLACLVECFLNWSGVLTWEYAWWSHSCPWLLWLIGYLPFFTMAVIVHDQKLMKSKWITLGIIFGVDIVLLVIFGIIGWL
jgi:hypothetical protein